MVIDEQSSGPFSLAEVILHPKLTPETLVWKPGLENWVPANTLTELAPAFARQQQEREYPEPPHYQSPNPEVNNPFANNPQYKQGHTYEPRNHYQQRYGNPYDNRYRPSMRTNWLPWAIVATIVGFFASCIGAIFGIIGIVQANKANTLYAQGYDREGDAANSNARIMTIIGLIFAAIGIIVAFSFGSLFSGVSNFNYF